MGKTVYILEGRKELLPWDAEETVRYREYLDDHGELKRERLHVFKEMKWGRSYRDGEFIGKWIQYL